MIRVNLLTDSDEMAHRAFYRWWTVKAWWGREYKGIKLGPVTVFTYIWFDGRTRLSMTTFGHNERILFGGRLS